MFYTLFAINLIAVVALVIFTKFMEVGDKKLSYITSVLFLLPNILAISIYPLKGITSGGLSTFIEVAGYLLVLAPFIVLVYIISCIAKGQIQKKE